MTDADITPNQYRLLDYIAECGRVPPKVQRRTVLRLWEAGLVDSPLPVLARVTEKGRKALRSEG